MASPTRGVFSCGNKHPSGTSEVIDYVQIMSTGDAVDFYFTVQESKTGIKITFAIIYIE